MAKMIIASGPVIVLNGKVLLNKHGDDDFWKFCGGRVEYSNDETLQAAAIREAKEEIGLDIKIINKSPFLFYVARIINGEEVDIILVHYLAELDANRDVTPGADIRELAWLNILDLGQEELGPNIIPTLQHFGFLN